MIESQRNEIAAQPGSDMKNTQNNSYGMSVYFVLTTFNRISFVNSRGIKRTIRQKLSSFSVDHIERVRILK